LAPAALIRKELVESRQIGWSSVGNGAELQLVFSPSDPLIALPRACTRRAVRFRRPPNEDIEKLVAATVNERGDRATLNDIYAAALQGETVVRQIVDRDRKLNLFLEPSSHRLRIGRIYVRYLARQEGAEMSIDNLSSEFGLIVLLFANPGYHPPQNQYDKKETYRSG
jgi:hypothetical protein